MWSLFGESVAGLRDDSVAAVVEKGSVEDLLDGMVGRTGLAEVTDGCMWRGGEPEPMGASCRRVGNNGAGDLIGDRDCLAPPVPLPSVSVFSSEDVCGELFLGYGLPLTGPFPLFPIGGNGGGASEVLGEEMGTRGGGIGP